MIKKILLFDMALCMIGARVVADEYTDLIAYRDQLKQQIEVVDSEIALCEKSLKGWKAATIIGGIGAVASGLGILAQNAQIKENKEILKNISTEAKEADEVITFIEKAKK